LPRLYLTKARLLFAGGVAHNLLAIALCLPLLRVPPGVTIKPMGLTCLLCIIGCSGPSFHLTVSKNTDLPGGDWPIKFVGTCLCYTPLPMSILLLQIYAKIQGFSFG
jgi:hypothetical protein